MATRVDSTSTGKALFKKNAHRPWKPALLEKVIHNPKDDADNIGEQRDSTAFESRAPQLEETLSREPLSRFKEYLQPSTRAYDEMSRQYEQKIEHIQQKITKALATKEKEVHEIQQKLSPNDNTRITFGGFFQPKNIIFSDENATLHKNALLMSELKEKEYEILELSQNLKLAQVKEHAERAQEALDIETKAREAAEERAIYALNQAQQATDHLMLAEQKLAHAEHSNQQLTHTINKLEQDLHASLLERHQTIEGLTSEIETKKRLEENLRQLENEIFRKQNVESHNHELSKDLAELERAHNQTLLENQTLSLRIQGLEQKLTDEDTKINTLQSRLESETARFNERLNTLIAEKDLTDDKLAKSLQQINKMNHLIHTERQLRKMFEEKARELSCQIFNLEIKLKAEQQAKYTAEEKVKQTMEQASKVMMRMFQSQP